MNPRPRTVTLALTLISLHALTWLGFAFILGADLHPALPDQALIRWGMAGLALAAGLVLLALCTLLSRRNRAAYALALGALTFSALLNFFDDVGWIDLVVFAVMVAPIPLLIKDRAWYLLKPETSQQQNQPGAMTQ